MDILTSVELFYEILETNKLKISQLMLQKSKFGYLISGALENAWEQKFSGFIEHTDELKFFWKLENIDNEGSLISGEELLS